MKLVLAADEKVVVVEKLTTSNGVARNGMARLNPEGNVDGAVGPSASPVDAPAGA